MRRRLTLLGTAAIAGVSLLAGCGSGGAAKAAGEATTPAASSAKTHHVAHPTCPLTGAAVASKADADRPVLGVKIDNVAPALPQAGLNSADMVVEEQVEGGLTRLFAAFECTPAASIGPIRSARTTDAALLALFHGSVFAFSGANPKVLPAIEATGHTTQVVYDSTPSLFHLDTSRPAPHDVFSSSTTLLNAGTQKRAEAKEKKLHKPPAVFSYGKMLSHQPKAKTATMSWPAASASWSWNGKEWLRTQDGEVDKTTDGQQISASNVVVMAVTLADTGISDVDGNPSPDDVVIGTGKAWVMRDGHVISGMWSRPTVTDTWTFKTHKGATIALAPGRTWVELLSEPQTFATSR